MELKNTMSFNQNVPAEKKQDTDNAALAIGFLRQGWNAQAFLLLSEPGSEKDPAARFAMGLCHLRADDPSSAIGCFEQALNLLKAASPSGAFVPKGASESSEICIRLTVKQIDDETYLDPMDADLCKCFPKAAEQTVIMAMIYAYMQKGMAEQAKRLSAGLIGPAFERYKERLTENR